MSAGEPFFDTNVLLCLLSGEDAKADRAEGLIAGGARVRQAADGSQSVPGSVEAKAVFMRRHANAMPPTLHSRIAQLTELWSIPELAAVVEVRFSNRLTRSLGRADATTGRIALAAFLAEDPALLDAALCHELAHLAAFRLVGVSERPHGPTWQRLVRAAGYEPTLRLLVDATETHGATGGRHRFTHSCPVCHFTRTAARPMRTWRCADCAAAGLDGRLEIIFAGPSR